MRNFGNVRWMMCLWLALSVSCGSSGSDEVRPLQSTASTTTAAASTPPVSTVEPPATSTTAAPASTTTISPWTDEQLEVIAAFEAGIEAFRLAGDAPIDPEGVSLATHTAAALEADRERLRLRSVEGRATRWDGGVEVNGSYVRVHIDGDTAELQGCFVDSGVAYKVESGDLLDDRFGARYIRGEVRLVDGSWRYEGFSTERVVEGDRTCAFG